MGLDFAATTKVAQHAGAGARTSPTVVDVFATPTGPKFGPLWPAVGLLDAHNSSLSPDAAPFFPSCPSGGRTKSQRWADDDGEEIDDDHPATFLEAARRSAKPTTASHMRAQTRSVVDLARGRTDTRQGHVRRQRKHRRWPTPAGAWPACSANGWSSPYPPKP